MPLAPQLVVRFFRRDDRIAHMVGRTEPSGEIAPLLESVEGVAGEDWPACPAFQHVGHERRGDVRVALLVGMAGKCHFSGAVEQDANGRWVFDFACRLQSRPDWLGCQYELGPGATFAPETGVLRSPAGECILMLDAPRPEMEANLSLDGSRVVISPSISADLEPPCTVRWRYSVEARDGDR